MDAALKFLNILQVLGRHGVDFILVGGVAAILEGAPVSTLDLAVVVLPTLENRERLLSALVELDARYFDPAGRHTLPDLPKLETMRLHRLLTRHGPLDVLETIGKDLRYEDLAGETEVYDVGGLSVRTLRLEMIIRSKEEANREKDQAVLPLLRQTLRMKKASTTDG
jgi:predicted nucleotidyltransferase